LIFISVMLTLILPILMSWVVPIEWETLIDAMPILVLAAIPLSTFGVLTTANIILETQLEQFILNCICLSSLGVTYIFASTLSLDIDGYLNLFVTVMLIISSIAVIRMELRLNGREYFFIAIVTATSLILLDYIWLKNVSNFWLLAICCAVSFLLKKEIKRISYG